MQASQDSTVDLKPDKETNNKKAVKPDDIYGLSDKQAKLALNRTAAGNAHVEKHKRPENCNKRHNPCNTNACIM